MLKIDLYSDIVCPWCAIGQHRLDKVLRERFPDLQVDIEHHPYELHPGAPPGGFRLDEFFRQRGMTDLSAAFAHVEGEARASGLELDLSQQTFSYRTVHAHTLLRHARERGTQHPLHRALVRAFFFEHRDVSDHAVLAEIAAQHGFRETEVEAILTDPKEQAITEEKIAASKSAGIVSVPTFRFGTLPMVGGRSEDEMAAAIEQAAQLAGRP